jgi:hypothetical protein
VKTAIQQFLPECRSGVSLSSFSLFYKVNKGVDIPSVYCKRMFSSRSWIKDPQHDAGNKGKKNENMVVRDDYFD